MLPMPMIFFGQQAVRYHGEASFDTTQIGGQGALGHHGLGARR